MSTQTVGATPAHPYISACAFSRPGWRRRIEVFGPKIGRRLSLGSYDAYRCWLVIEANPAIMALCERPTFVDGPGGAVIDFWVQLRGAPAGEFWLIEPRRVKSRANSAVDEPSIAPPTLHGLPTRLVRQEDLRAWEVPITNWGRIVPYLASHRRFRDADLAAAALSGRTRFQRA